METKLFEVRDRMTFIPVIAIKLDTANEQERYLLAMSGYGLQAEDQRQYVLMGKLQTGKLECVPQEHDGYPGVRTLPTAHHHILTHWDEIKTGDVVDVEFIAGEKTEPKISQRIENSPLDVAKSTETENCDHEFRDASYKWGPVNRMECIHCGKVIND